MKISVLKRIEALHLPPDMNADISEDENNVILTLRFSKTDNTVLEAPAKQPRQHRSRVSHNGNDKDILATFAIKTPMDSGPQVLTMGKEEVRTTNLKDGVLKLLEICGIKPELVAAYPESDGKRLIEGILK